MAFTLSVSLRETARLYLRYMTVGLVCIPLALLYAGARRADWNTTVVAGALIVLGFVGAFFVWRRLGDWRVVPADTSIEAWVDLLRIVAQQQTAVSLQQRLLQYRPRVDDETLGTYRKIFTRIASDDEIRKTAFNRILAHQQATLEQLSVVQGQSSQPNRTGTRPETQQGQPAWALALSGGLA